MVFALLTCSTFVCRLVPHIVFFTRQGGHSLAVLCRRGLRAEDRVRAQHRHDYAVGCALRGGWVERFGGRLGDVDTVQVRRRLYMCLVLLLFRLLSTTIVSLR